MKQIRERLGNRFRSASVKTVGRFTSPWTNSR